jgi:hypothetical protein
MPTETSADPPPTLPNKPAHPDEPLFAEVSLGGGVRSGVAPKAT